MRRIVVITGLSGSGKSTAKDAFEDMGFYCIDNFPVIMLEEFLTLSGRYGEDIGKMTFVMDARAHDFVDQFPRIYEKLKQQKYRMDLIFLEASDEVLGRRFSETRRKHPLSMNRSALEGIRKEREILKDIRTLSTRVINTSDFNVHKLKDLIYRAYGQSISYEGMSVNITSFGYRFGLPIDADIILDVRFLLNPYFKEELKYKTGKEKEVQSFVLNTREAKSFMKKLKEMLRFLLPLYEKEWKAYLNICIGCTGGKHRSVVISEEIAKFVKQSGREYSINHRDLDRT